MAILTRLFARRWPDPLLVVTAVLVYWLAWRRGEDPLGRLPRSGRENLQQTLAGLGVALLGLGATVSAIVFALTPGRRLAAVLRTWGRQLNRLLGWTLLEFAASTLLFVALAGLDGGAKDHGQRYGMVAGLAAMVLGVTRLLVLLGFMLNVAGVDATRAATLDALAEPVDPTTFDYSRYRLQHRRLVRSSRSRSVSPPLSVDVQPPRADPP